MITYLASTTDITNIDKLIMLKHIPPDFRSTMQVIRNPKDMQCSKLDEENIRIDLDITNYRDNLDEFILHVMERKSEDKLTAILYKIEENEFRSIRKLTTTLS